MTGSPISNLRVFESVPPSPERQPATESVPSRFLANSPLPLNSAQRQELQALNRESDPELLRESLLSLGSRWENQGHESLALALYQEILAQGEAPGMDRVRRRAEALTGQGEFGSRFEVASRNFARQATDPAMIFGFMVAGFVATAVRSYAATSLALRAESVLSRGWAARSLAGSAAYFAEVPSFVGSVRLAHGVLGYDQGFGNLETLPGELGGAALFLGALKLSAAAAQSLLGNSLSRPLVHGMGTLGGIYLGHRMEETFGLRTPQVEMNRWFDVAETFLQLKVGGQLASSLHRTASSHLTMRLAALEAPTLRLATGGEWFHENHRPLDLAATFKNLENTAETQVRQDLEFETLRTRLGETLGPRATTMVVQMVQGIGRQMKVGDSLVQIVGGSQYPSIYGLEMAMRRINYAATYAFPRGLTGSYLNWVVRVAAESAIRRNDQARFDRLVAFLAEGASIDQLEALASELDPRLRLFPETLLARNLRIAEVMTLRGESHKKIRALPLSREAKQTLLAYVRIMAEENDRRRVAEVLGDWLRRNPDHKDIIQNILSRARLNPGGAMRAQRMMNVLMYEPSNLPKLRELYDADLGARGRGNLIPPYAEAEMILGTQDDGYLAEPDLARELSILYRRMPDLLNAEKAAYRNARTREILEEVWSTNQEPMDIAHLRQALAMFGDPISDAIERDLGEQRFRLNFLARPEFERLFQNADEKFPRRNFGGLFIPAARDASGEDSIYLMKVEGVSHEVYRDILLERLVQLVHEHVHFRRAPLQTNRRLRGTYLEEMVAETQAFHWQAEQGQIRLLNHYLNVNAAGLGMYLRDWVNLTYFVHEDREL